MLAADPASGDQPIKLEANWDDMELARRVALLLYRADQKLKAKETLHDAT